MKKLFLTAVCLLFALTAFGQVSLEVSVVNKLTGEAVSGLEVTLANQDIGYSHISETNKQGKAFFKGLTTSGSYTATTTETDTYYSLAASGIVFRSNTDQSVTMAITPKSTKELGETTVQANNSVARINTINAEVSAELDLEQVEALPIRARDFTLALFRLPNVTKATGGFVTAPVVSVNDVNPNYTNYLIDGLDNNENDVGGPKFPIPKGAIQNISVLSSNYTAEFGQSVGGVINVTTKSGGNTFKGEVYGESRPGPVIDGQSDFIQRDHARAGYQRYQGGFNVGGPIVKDKTFYFLDVEGTINKKDNILQVPQLNVSNTLRGYDHEGLFSAKIDQYWTDNFHSSLRGNVGLITLEREGGGLNGGGFFFPSASYAEDRNSLLIANKNTYFSSNFSSTTSLQYSRFYWNYSRALKTKNSPDVTLLDPQNMPIAHIGSPGFPFIEYENTGELKQKFTFSRGNHQIKVGGGIITSDFSLSGGGNPNGSYVVALNQSQIDEINQKNLGVNLGINDVPSDATVSSYSVNLRSEPFGRVQNRFNVYAEDAWSVSPRLSITYGLRFYYDNSTKGGGDTGDINNFGPRVSFNYKLNSKSVIRGGYGRFFQKTPYTIISDALEFGRTGTDFRQQIQALIDAGQLPEDTNIDKVTFDGPLSASVPGVGYLQGPSRQELQNQRNGVFTNTARILNPNGYKNPYSDQFEIGYQRQLQSEILFTVDLFYNRTRDLYTLRELNSPSSYPVSKDFAPGDARSPAEADASRPVPILTDDQGRPYGLVNGQRLYGISRGVAVGTNEGDADYYAATFGLKKDRGDDDFSYQFFYTLSHNRTNTGGFNFRAVDNNRFDDEFGPSINDRTHVLEGFFTYYPARGLSFTTTAQIQSGQPINRVPDGTQYFYTDENGNKVFTTDLNGNGIGRSFAGDNFNPILDRAPGESRNSDRLPWATTFDVSAKYQLPMGGRQKLEFRADIFNVFNTENLSGFVNDGVPTNQIQVGPASSGLFVQHAASPPRQFQFSVRYLF